MVSSSSQTSTDGELSNLLDLFDSASSIKEKVEHLTSITSTILPGMQLDELESKVFSKLLPKLHDVMFHTLDTVAGLVKSLPQDQICDVTSDVQIQLQAILSFLECIETCVTYVTHFTGEILISHIHSLPLAVIKIIQSAFRHCKESTSLYGEVFQLVSDELSLLFRKTYQLQKAVMDLVERVQLTFDVTEMEVVHMASICHEVLEICILIGEMDTSLLVNTWKVLNRLVTKHKDHIKTHLDVDRVLIHLCISVEAKFTQCVQLAPRLETGNQIPEVNNSGDTKTLNKMLKIVRFLMGHLMHLVKEFIDYIDKSHADLLHLLIALQSKVPPCLTALPLCDTTFRDIFSSVLVVVEPLLGILVTNKHFADTLTRFPIKDMRNPFQAALCFTLTKVVAIMPLVTEEVFAYWVAPQNYPEEDPRISIVQALFQSLNHASVELSLPVYVDGVMCKGKPHREVSFYDHVCTRLCALVAVSPRSCFEQIEKCLLENVLSDDLLPALLASDVWCFVARWGSANLCYDHITFLCELLLKLRSEGKSENVHLKLLIRRLLCLLAPEHQENLASTFSPSKFENVPLWSLAPLHWLQSSVTKKVCCCITPMCIKACHAWVKGDQPTGHENLGQCLACLQNIYSSTPKVRNCVPPVHHAGLINVVNCMWTKVRQNEGQGMSEKTCSQMIALTGALVPFLQPDDYVKSLGGIRRIVLDCQSDVVLISAAQFLGNCGAKEVSSTHETSVFDDISQMYTVLVSHSSSLVHQHAMESVKSFAEKRVADWAEFGFAKASGIVTGDVSVVQLCFSYVLLQVTRYTHIMADCVPERLLPVLEDFLNQVPYKHKELSLQQDSTKLDAQLLQKEKEEIQRILGESDRTVVLSDAEKSDCTDPQQKKPPKPPQAKRVRCDTASNVDEESSKSPVEINEGDELYWQALNPMKVSLETIVALQKKQRPSNSVLEELKTFQATLCDLLSQVS